MNELLRGEGLCKQYRLPDGRTVDALRDFSLTVAAGEWLGVIGASGAGKSTLCRVLLGLTKPDAGALFFQGKPVTDRKARRQLRAESGMIFQHPAAAMNLSMQIWEVIAEPLEVAGLARTERQNRANTLLEKVGLPEELFARRAGELSGGQQQRVATARALANGPKLLLADEATASLDLSAAAQLLNLLAELRGQGIGGVFLSHDLAAVRWLCDRVTVLHQGRAVETGLTAQVFEKPQHPHTRRLLGNDRF